MIGSFLQDRFRREDSRFRFKHHYILNALDSEILYELVITIGEKRMITMTKGKQKTTVLPLKLYISTQTGRQYLLARTPWNNKFAFFRTDLINAVKSGDRVEVPENLAKRWNSSRAMSGA